MYSWVPGGRPVKSTITSNRSATATRRLDNWTGRGRNPPSVPITQIGSAAFDGLGRLGRLAIFSSSTRVLDALRIRNRYRRGATVSVGQVLPLTTMVFPKNSGFHIGGTSVSGIHGPSTGVSPKNPRVSGKKSEPLELKDLHWISSGISW